MAVRIVVNANGPLRIEGDFELVDREGQPYGLGGRPMITLCRCGHSANKPFCDGSHAREAFREPAIARDLPPRPGS
jgi:CDGSH-type Zn-finger protein